MQIVSNPAFSPNSVSATEAVGLLQRGYGKERVKRYAERLAEAGAAEDAGIVGELRIASALSFGIRPRRAAWAKYSVRPLRFSASRE